jgi:hypothetical protein
MHLIENNPDSPDNPDTTQNIQDGGVEPGYSLAHAISKITGFFPTLMLPMNILSCDNKGKGNMDNPDIPLNTSKNRVTGEISRFNVANPDSVSAFLLHFLHNLHFSIFGGVTHDS